MKQHVMKEKIKTLETKWNGGNIITEINIWAISLLRYSAAFLDFTKGKIRAYG